MAFHCRCGALEGECVYPKCYVGEREGVGDTPEQIADAWEKWIRNPDWCTGCDPDNCSGCGKHNSVVFDPS